MSAFSSFILTAFTTLPLKALLIAGKFPYNCLSATYLCNVILSMKCEELWGGMWAPNNLISSSRGD